MPNDKICLGYKGHARQGNPFEVIELDMKSFNFRGGYANMIQSLEQPIIMDSNISISTSLFDISLIHIEKEQVIIGPVRIQFK